MHASAFRTVLRSSSPAALLAPSCPSSSFAPARSLRLAPRAFSTSSLWLEEKKGDTAPAAPAANVVTKEGSTWPAGSDQASQESAQAIAHQAHMDSGLTGHERADITHADLVSGAPAELRRRQVRIFKPTKSTMQSGKAGMNHWRIDWDTLSGSGRWINPLMGWASSADYMQGTSLKFKTEQAAIDFCDRQGWDYIVSKPNVQPFKPKNYAENFVHVPGKLRLARTK